MLNKKNRLLRSQYRSHRLPILFEEEVLDGSQLIGRSYAAYGTPRAPCLSLTKLKHLRQMILSGYVEVIELSILLFG